MKFSFKKGHESEGRKTIYEYKKRKMGTKLKTILYTLKCIV